MTTTSPARLAISGIRTAIGISGAIALIVGVLMLVWPIKTAFVVTMIVAVYAIAAGIVYAGIGVFSRVLGGWSRAGHVVLGVLFVVAGVLAFFSLESTTLWLAVFVAIFLGVTWIIEGIVALTTLRGPAPKGWTIFYAVVSILAGLVLALSPLWSAFVLWVFLGVSLVVFGVIAIVRAIAFGRAAD